VGSRKSENAAVPDWHILDAAHRRRLEGALTERRVF
jgi:hypothetical protein